MTTASLYYMKRIQVQNEALLLCPKAKTTVSYANPQCTGKVGDALQKVVSEVVKGIFLFTSVILSFVTMCCPQHD